MPVVPIDFEELELIVREELREATGSIGASQTLVSVQSFRLGRPVPTYRL